MGLEAYQHGAGRLWKARNPIRTRRGFHAEVPSPVVRPWLPCQQTGVGKAAGIDVVVHGGNTLECGGKRSATPLWHAGKAVGH